MTTPTKTDEQAVEETPLQKRRRAAEQEIAAIAKRDADAREEREIALLEARAKYGVALGAEGVDWALVDGGGEGPIVVKLGAMVLYKEFRAKIQEGPLSFDTAQKFILGCGVFPDRPRLLEVLNRRSGLHDDIVVALLKLHGQNEAVKAGK